MVNAMNYAKKYSGQILEAIQQGALTSPFIESNVQWLGAKTFHFTQMNTSGYKDHSRQGGWNKGTITQKDHEFTVEHDRDISFLVDAADVDETAQTAAMMNVTRSFVNDNQIPEIDAYTFSKIASAAVTAGLSEEADLSTWTAANVYTKLVGLLGKTNLKLYRQRGTVVGYVRTEIMDLIAQSTELSKTVEIVNLSGPMSIETRVAKLNGVPLIEVLATDRFYDSFSFTEGFAPVASTSKAINVLFAALDMVHTVPKISSIYYFARGSHTEGDGDLYQNRSLWDTFIFPNGLTGKVDSVFVSKDKMVYSADRLPAVVGTAQVGN